VSQENVELVRLGFEAFVAGDTAAFEGYLTPDVEVVQPPEVPDAKTYRGPAAMRHAMDDWPSEWEDFHMELLEVIDVSDDTLVSVTRHRGRGGHSEIELDYQVSHVYRLREGKLARLEMYFSRDQALKAVGLAE
jgi:ketosteroid isomerase-like protein